MPRFRQTGLWVQNAPAVRAFLAIASQWRVVASERTGLRFIGLDYDAGDAGLRRAGIETTPEDWEGVRIMEAEARRILNEG